METPCNRMNRRKKIISFGMLPVLAWLFVQFSMASGAFADTSAQGHHVGHASQQSHVEVICSVHGPILVRVLADGSFEIVSDDQKEDRSPVPTHSCEWCQSFGQFTYAHPDTPNWLIARETRDACLSHSHDYVDVRKLFSSGFRSRAPPAKTVI